MAEQEDQDARTEDASGRRLEKAYEDGDVPVSRDAAMLGSFAAAAVVLLVSSTALLERLVRLVQGSAHALVTGQARDLVPLVAAPAWTGGLVCVAATLGAVVVMLAQTRGGFWAQRVLPDPKRMFGGGRLGRMFKGEALVDMGLSLVKIVTLGTALWWALRADFVALPGLLRADIGEQLGAMFRPLSTGLVKFLTALALVAGVDLAVTHLRFRRKMKMTKDELRREYKEDEGDPLIRSRRRRRHRELAKAQVAVEVPRADVVLVNPTHIAVALRYRAGEDRAPRVTAKGKGQLAEVMRDLARANGIPIVENVPLARLLYRRVKVGRAVPADTFKAVAAVLAFVYRVLGRNLSQQGAAAR